jgi:hypothetical protein
MIAGILRLFCEGCRGSLTVDCPDAIVRKRWFNGFWHVHSRCKLRVK